MKGIVFSIFIFFILFGCTPRYQRITDNHHIVNQTNKEIIHILYCNHPLVKQDSFIYHVESKCDTTLEWTVSAITGIVTDYGYLTYNGFRVYNITDTTTIFWKDLWGGYEYDSESIPMIFNRSKGITEYNDKKNESIWITNYYLTINDTLLSLMKKDYSMLERFKEYYQK